MLPYYREDCAKKKGAYNMKIDYNLLPSTVPHPHLLTGNPVCNPTFLQPDIEIPKPTNSVSKHTPPLIIIIIHFLLLNILTILGLRWRLGDGNKN